MDVAIHLLFEGSQHAQVAERALLHACVHLLHHARGTAAAGIAAWLLGQVRLYRPFLVGAQVAHRDALGIAVEFQHHEISLIVDSEGTAFLLVEVLAVTSSFQTVGQCDGGVTAFHLDHGGLVLAADREHALEDLPWILFDLLVTEAHAAVFLVQFEHHDFDFVAHVAELRGVLDFLGPAEVRNVHQTVDAFFQFDKQAEVGEVAHLSFLLGFHRVSCFDVLPWVLGQLLQAKGHLALLAVNAQQDAFDFVVDFQEVLGAAQVLRPRDFADVEQSFHTWGDLHKRTVVRHDHHTTLDLGAFHQIFAQRIPWVRGELLHAQGNSLLVVVEIQDHHVDLLVHFHHLLWVTHTAVAHVGDVHQTVDASEVYEHTVRSDVLDSTFEDLTDFEALDDETLLLFELGLNEGLVRHHHVLELLVDLDNLEFHLLADILVEVADGLDVHLRTREERFQTKDVHDQAALGAALDRTLDDHVFFLGFVHLVPSVIDARRLVTDHKLAVGVLLLFNEHRHFVSCLQFWIVAELTCANDTFRLVANVDHNLFFANGNHSAFHHFFFFDEGEALFIEVLETLALFRAVIVLLTFESVPIEITSGLGKLSWL